MRYLLLFVALNIFTNTAAFDLAEFDTFIVNIKNQALKQNISTQTLTVLDNLIPNPRIIELDNTQAEFSLNFWQYINSRVNPRKVLLGNQKIKQNEKLFNDIYAKYGVPKHILIAFWGLESNYGVITGSFNLVQSLATLAFDKRRRGFFTRQLLTTLQLIDEKKLNKQAKSSWAGAMGSMQFMPTNVATYGLDMDYDGKINLWDSKDDIFHSAANFLTHIGWNKGERWGREVIIPKNFDYNLTSLKIKKPIQIWHTLGILTTDGKPLPISNITGSIILPMGYKGPAFLVYDNFHAILNWNRSILYALSVGILADKLIGVNLKAKFIYEPKLSKNNVKFIQQKLAYLNFYTLKVDGISGSKTREAAKKYQLAKKIPADGYVGYKLLQQLKNDEYK